MADKRLERTRKAYTPKDFDKKVDDALEWVRSLTKTEKPAKVVDSQKTKGEDRSNGTRKP